MAVTVVGAPTADEATRTEHWLLAQLRRPGQVLIVTGPLLVAALVGMMVHTGGRHIDLEVYRFGVQAWLAGGDLYGRLPETGAHVALPFIYPPFAALLMVPLAVAPWTVAWVGLLLASTCALGATVFVVARRLWPSGGRRAALSITSIALPLAMAVEPGKAIDFSTIPDETVRAPFALEPVLANIEFGQVNLLLMALVALDCLAVRPRWPRGLLVGIAAAIKLTPAAFVLYFLLRRDYRAAATAAIAGAVATLVGFDIAPAASLRFWLDNPAAGVGAVPYYTNQSFQAVLTRLGVEGGARTAWWLVASAVLLALAVPVIRRAPAPLAMVATAGVALLVSPTSWSHHWVWVAPALLVAVASTTRSRSPWWAAVTVAMAAVFVIAPHRQGLPRSADRELSWSWSEQILGDSYVWFTVLLFVMAWWAWRSPRGTWRWGSGSVGAGPGATPAFPAAAAEGPWWSAGTPGHGELADATRQHWR